MPKWLAIALLIFSKNSSSLNIFSTREDSAVKMFAGRCFRKNNDCRGALIKKKLFAEENFSSPPPLQKNTGPSLSHDDFKHACVHRCHHNFDALAAGFAYVQSFNLYSQFHQINHAKFKLFCRWKYSSRSRTISDISRGRQCSFMSFSALLCAQPFADRTLDRFHRRWDFCGSRSTLCRFFWK